MRLTESERTWNWIDDGVLPYALAALRAVWVWTFLEVWTRVLFPERGEFIPPLIVFALLAGGTLCAQIAVFRLREGRAGTILVAGGGLLAVAFTLYLALGASLLENFGALILLLVVAAFLWRWGIVVGREPQTYDTYARNFAYGLVGLASAVFIAYVTRVAPLSAFVLPILLYFGIGLALLAISSLREAQKYERAETGESFALNRYWLGTVGAVIGALLIVGLLLGGLFAPEAARGLLGILAVLLGVLTRIFLLVVYVIAFLFFGALELIGRVVHLQPTTQPPQIQEPPRLDELFKDVAQQPSNVSPEVYLILQILAGSLLAVLVVLIFTVAFRRFRQYGEEDVEETRESVFSMELLQEQLRKLFRRGPAKQVALAPFAEIRGDDARAQIRKVYQEFLTWAAARGISRQAGQTPNEFVEAAARLLELDPQPARVLTSAYLKARYSREPIETSVMDAVRHAWQEIARTDGAGESFGRSGNG